VASGLPAWVPGLQASDPCPTGPQAPLALWLRSSYPWHRSEPPPCRPVAAARVRPGHWLGRGGSLRAAWVVRVYSPRLTQRCPRASGSHPYSPECLEGKFSEVLMQDCAQPRSHTARNSRCPHTKALGSTQHLPTPDKDATACIKKCCQLAREPCDAWPRGTPLLSWRAP
jgi:hypothetical protein